MLRYRWAWVVAGVVAMTVAAWLFRESTTPHEPTREEREATFRLRQMGVSPEEADRLAAEVRAVGARPHETTGHLQSDVDNLLGDVARMGSYNRWRLMHEAQQAHERRWRRWAFAAAAAGVLAIACAVIGFRRRRVEADG